MAVSFGTCRLPHCLSIQCRSCLRSFWRTRTTRSQTPRSLSASLALHSSLPSGVRPAHMHLL